MAKSKIDVIGSVTPIDGQQFSEKQKETGKSKLERYKDQEAYKMVKGRFRIIDMPDGTPEKVHCRKYKGVEPFEKTMISGGTYEIPLYVARFLQGYDVTAEAIGGQIHSCSYALHGYVTQAEGMPEHDLDGVQKFTEPKKYIRRYAFESLEFENAM